jgi:hypothetical protein
VGAFTVPLGIAGGLALLLVVLAALFTLRRLAIARGASFDCSLRTGTADADPLPGGAPGGGRWSIGVARYGSDRLEWFRIFSLSPRPARCFERDRFELVSQRVPSVPESRAVLPGTTVVSARYDSGDVDLAMSPEAYTGLASWLEAAPPGRTGQVT